MGFRGFFQSVAYIINLFHISFRVNSMFVIPTVEVGDPESSHCTLVQENMKEKRRKGSYLPRD